MVVRFLQMQGQGVMQTGCNTFCIQVFQKLGVPEEDALGAILPLARGSLENLERMGPVQGLTGPISRGDLETIRLHLRALEPRERALYASLGLELRHLGMEGELEEDTAEEIRELLERE